MVCEKVTFATRKDAKCAIKNFKHRYKNSSLSAYKCPHCTFFHLTSNDSLGKRISRSINLQRLDLK